MGITTGVAVLGDRFNRLIIVELLGIVNGRTTVIAQCDCGVKKNYAWSFIYRGKIKSCGCYKEELMKTLYQRVNYKHHLTNHPLYGVWSGIKDRCFNPKNPNYKYYGGRGITMCSEWGSDFIVFYEWAKDKYQKGLEIDREEVNGDYTPSNCRFITQPENSRNKRSNVRIEYKGKTQCVAEWARELNFTHSMIFGRMKRWGNDYERIFETPPMYFNKQKLLTSQ